MMNNVEKELYTNQVKTNEQMIHLTDRVCDLATIVKEIQGFKMEIITKYATMKGYAAGVVACTFLLGTGFVWSVKTTANQMIVENTNTNRMQSEKLELIQQTQENHELRISSLEHYKHLEIVRN